MITSAELTKAIEEVLVSYQDLNYATIERGVVVNSDVNNMPWVGIYPGEISFDPGTLGSGTCRWVRTMHPLILLQEQDYSDIGQTAADKLDELLNKIVMAISSTHNKNLKFGLTGVRLLRFDVTYTYQLADEDESGDLYFPQCEIKLDVEVRE